jgi:protein SCO1
MTRRGVMLLLICLLLSASAGATTGRAGFGFHQRPGAQVPMDAPLWDQNGHAVRLRDFVHTRPAILVLGYYHCPNLCGVVRDDLLHALSLSGLRPDQYNLIVLSIDPSETRADAVSAERQDLARHPVPGAKTAWHYLLGSASSVRGIAAAVGFPYRYDTQLKQFLHPTGLVFLNTAGRVSGYLLGVGYTPGDLASGITRAGMGGIEQAAAPILLLCFHFDPNTGRYTLAIVKVLQLAGLVSVLIVATTIGLALRRERLR